jgi:hypothetical protein
MPCAREWWTSYAACAAADWKTESRRIDPEGPINGAFAMAPHMDGRAILVAEWIRLA